MRNREKIRAQVKSRFYYFFWGAATVSVFVGQLYVGTGYRAFSKSLNRLFDTIEVEVRKDAPLFIRDHLDPWDDTIADNWTK